MKRINPSIGETGAQKGKCCGWQDSWSPTAVSRGRREAQPRARRDQAPARLRQLQRGLVSARGDRAALQLAGSPALKRLLRKRDTHWAGLVSSHTGQTHGAFGFEVLWPQTLDLRGRCLERLKWRRRVNLVPPAI